ncbi:glycosyltransferase family 4 protein [Gammaproteobacteria bacterium]|nr:glycosyltransferase family 4 protein [Gammaproteobacteria bacterium]
MQLVLVADAFPPLRSSAAVQLRDLTIELIKQGVDLLVIIPDSNLEQNWKVEDFGGAKILRLYSLPVKNINYFYRTLNEFLMPFFMRRNLLKSPFRNHKFDGVIWYSPSIFHAPFVKYLKKKSQCKSYLIIRDIFPDWALDMGLIKQGIIYWCFKLVANYQYSIADIIGVQTPGNKIYFEKWQKKNGKTLSILDNWLIDPDYKVCSIEINKTSLAGRKIFVYAGNMGVAQGMDEIIDLAESMISLSEIGFIFVGRGSEVARLKQKAKDKKMVNVLFFDEIDPDEIPSLYSQCRVGVVALDARHKTHNIPGKFITYMQCGLPVLANINLGNDLKELIETHNVGRVKDIKSKSSLKDTALLLLNDITEHDDISKRCRALFKNRFHASSAVKNILSHFN